MGLGPNTKQYIIYIRINPCIILLWDRWLSVPIYCEAQSNRTKKNMKNLFVLTTINFSLMNESFNRPKLANIWHGTPLDGLSSFNYLLNERRSLEEERQQPVGGCCFLSEFPSHSGPSPHTIFFGLASNWYLAMP